MIDYKTEAKPRGKTADGIPVFCAYDRIMPIADVRPNPDNPNEHSKKQIELLADIIQATGWRAPITISKRSGLVTKGHGRRMAALAKRWKEVPVEYQDYASAEEEHADLIADNRIAELSNISAEKLIDMLQDMDTGAVPMEMTGYNDDEIEKMLAALEGADGTEDDAADAETDVSQNFTRSGDLWHLANHRLICGSATSILIAAHRLGRICYTVELDPKYCDAIVERFAKETEETGASITCERDGKEYTLQEIRDMVPGEPGGIGGDNDADKEKAETT